MLLSFLHQKYRKIFETRNFSEMIVYSIIYFIRKCFDIRVMRICTLKAANINISLDSDNYIFQRISPADLKEYHYNKERITEEDITIAESNHDILYVATEKGQRNIVSYGWYSRVPTLINKCYKFSFPENYIYMYNGYTEPEHRGASLHARGMGHAAQDISKKNNQEIISFVDAENYRSIRSCTKLGYQFIGYIITLKLFKQKYHFKWSWWNKMPKTVDAIPLASE